MVKSLICALLILPALLFSDEFTATISSNQVNVGENLILSLTLKDVTATSSPATQLLNDFFHVNSEQQYQNTSITNGRVSSSTTWKISLSPKNVGEITIPAFSINTSKGRLTTNPILVKVDKANPNDPNASPINGITTSIEFSKLTPYKNEPFLFTTKLVSKHSLMNVRINKFQVDDAIVELSGEPRIQKRIIEGVNCDVIELSYLITPLKSGSLNIPPIVLHGALPMKAKRHQGSRHDDDFDAFFMGFNQLQPFTFTTNETVIDVQQPIAGIQPWLPAKAFEIEETWDDSLPLQAGEPLTRSFKIRAVGIAANQLPNLSDLQGNESNFKIYADNPETGQEIKNGNINSFRNEKYTLLPQQPGVITLPTIAIHWWDVNKNEKATAYIPARTLNILPATTTEHIALNDEAPSPTHDLHQTAPQRDPVLYILIAGLATLLCGVIIWAIALQKKIQRLTTPLAAVKQNAKVSAPIAPLPTKLPAPTVKVPPKSKQEKLPDLNPT